MPILGIGSCLYLMLGLPTLAWIRLGVWMVVGLLLYFSYGYRHSRLRSGQRPSTFNPASGLPPSQT